MDRSSFQQFYQRYFDKIYRFVALRIADRETVEDLVSDIFFKALRAFDTYDQSKSKSGWIYAIARNHLANHYRSSGRVIAGEDLEDLPILGENFERKMEMNHDLMIVKKTLAELPQGKQDLIRLKYLEQWTYEEIAEQIGKDKGTVKVATFRAMKDLRLALKDKL